jgi:hypothetical protein
MVALKAFIKGCRHVEYISIPELGKTAVESTSYFSLLASKTTVGRCRALDEFRSSATSSVSRTEFWHFGDGIDGKAESSCSCPSVAGRWRTFEFRSVGLRDGWFRWASAYLRSKLTEMLMK